MSPSTSPHPETPATPPTYREKALIRINGLNETFLRMYMANYTSDPRRFKEQSQQYIVDITELLEKVAGETLKRPIEAWFKFQGEHNRGRFQQALELLERYGREFKRVPEVEKALKK